MSDAARTTEPIGDRLSGRIAIITGAGRGIGREHALLFAREGARVVVNDLRSPDAATGAPSAAEEVVAEIAAMGGEAVANHDDVADTDGARRLIETAIESFGGLHVLVNNAGILRDRMVVNMTDDEWDSIMRVHLRGHFLTVRNAAGYWRDRSKAGEPVKASIINTTSTSGLMSNVGQSNYGAAKSGIATFTEICQKELARYGVRVNAIAPAARTRLTLASPGADERYARLAQEHPDFDISDPANISPFVAYLATESCPIAGKVFFVYANKVHLFQPWTIIDHVATEGRWTIDGLAQAAAKWGDVHFDQHIPVE
jgi:NAD(P)-dependent dehydrogenase (short-subunit alcohol dehydrogenase family)